MVRDTEELEKVEQLRHRLKDIMKPDMLDDSSLFLRFLKARTFDINAAEIMLRKYINWRTTNKVDTLLDWYVPHEVFEKYICCKLVSFDKEGSPVIYLPFGNVDLRGLVSSFKLSDVRNFLIWCLEKDIKSMKAQSEKLNKTVDQWVYIYDFDKLPLSTATHKPSIELLIDLFSLYEANYPERLKSALLINTTRIFQLGYVFIKPLLTGPTLQKVTVYGREGWKEELLKNVDADELPVFLGGNKMNSDDDPYYSKITNPGKIPEQYYMMNQKANFLTKSDVKKLIVKRLSKERIEVNVLHPNSDIEWEFQTKERDIAFSFLQKYGSEVKEIISKQRCDASLSSEIGLFKCKDSGTYCLEFDNTYSWFHQKEIYYKYNITENSGKENGL